MTIKIPEPNKIAIDRFWLSLVAGSLVWVFSAGIGWNKLSYAEESISKLTIKVEAVESNKLDTVRQLTMVDGRVQELIRSVEKLSTQVDRLSKAREK